MTPSSLTRNGWPLGRPETAAPRLLPGPHFSGFDTVGGRSGAPVSVHLKLESFSGRVAETSEKGYRAFCQTQGAHQPGALDQT